jgi:hypothetical protein
VLGMVSKGCHAFRVSLYADDDVVFIKPTPEDLSVTNCILDLFVGGSGLMTNLNKTLFFPIQCQQVDLNFLSQNNLVTSSFHCTYLGLLLHIKRLPSAIFDQVIQKIAVRILGWKRKLLAYLGRETLVKSVMSAMPTFFLAVFKMPRWASAKVDWFRRGFL